MRSAQFGGKISKHWKARYESSPNWQQGAFRNLVETQTAINWRQLPGIICKQIKGHKEGSPRAALPVQPLDKAQFLAPAEASKFVWYGHSVLLMRVQGKTLLIDPMLGEDASPIAPTKTRRFSSNTLGLIDTLPDIDLVLISHDHYDHLDYDSIARLKSKSKRFFVALGVKRHLVHWGIDPEVIEEFDWWDNKPFDDLHITFTPTRHFSGRGITSIAKCLWGGWAIRTPSDNIWFSGDGGYADHFLEIGERLGPFDIGFMECGQYCTDWAQIHMFPDECAQAAIDAKVKVAMPVHWGAFSLSYEHGWYEPVESFSRHAHEKALPCLTPALGEVFYAKAAVNTWWMEHK